MLVIQTLFQRIMDVYVHAAMVTLFKRHECVIFLQYNYNLLIPSVAKAFSERCKATKSKEFICKKCHTSLKIGKIPGIIV